MQDSEHGKSHVVRISKPTESKIAGGSEIRISTKGGWTDEQHAKRGGRVNQLLNCVDMQVTRDDTASPTHPFSKRRNLPIRALTSNPQEYEEAIERMVGREYAGTTDDFKFNLRVRMEHEIGAVLLVLWDSFSDDWLERDNTKFVEPTGSKEEQMIRLADIFDAVAVTVASERNKTSARRMVKSLSVFIDLLSLDPKVLARLAALEVSPESRGKVSRGVACQ